MARRPKTDNSELLRSDLVQLLIEFEQNLADDELRPKVLTLVKAFHKLRDLGSSLMPVDLSGKRAARERILQYFRRYVGVILHSDEFLVVSGIQEYARRIRELRVQSGWPIISGETAKEMIEAGELDLSVENISPDTYVLLRDEQDKEAAHRWHLANTIRGESWGMKKKFLEYFRTNVGKPINGEELKYLVNGASDWQRRIRELRTEEGWPIKTKNTGRRDLPIGTYILEEDRQSETHDRNISEPVQVKVLERDNYRCIKCSWSYDKKVAGDPRHFLELHHIKHHARGGENVEENLATLCNVHHDEIHRLDKRNDWTKGEFFSWVDAP